MTDLRGHMHEPHCVSICVLGVELLQAYLLRDGPVPVLFQAVQLISLPQQRVEGFGCTVDRGGVRRDRKGRHQAHLLQGGVAASSTVQELAVFQILGQPLQHGQRLVEVYLQTVSTQFKCAPVCSYHSKRSLCLYRHRYLGKVFADAILHNAPQVEGVIWLVRNTTAPCSTQLHVICARGVLEKTQNTKASGCVKQRGGC